MFEVERIYEAVREEGTNQGVITTFVRLGPGSSYSSVDEFMAELYPSLRTTWICFCGEDTTRVGMGTLIQALKELRYSVELMYSGNLREPGWFNSVDLWMVDYLTQSFFSYNRLRPRDSVRFKVPDEVKMDFLLNASDALGMCAAVRLASLAPNMDINDLSVLANFGRAERLRVGRRQE